MHSISLAALEAADARRIEALVKADLAALSEGLHDELVLIHSNGRHEGKQAFVAAIADGGRRYRAITPRKIATSIRGGVPVVIGIVTIKSEAAGQAYDITAAYTAIYTTESPPRLIAYQASLMSE
jgi:hypothetical protein